MFKRVFQCMIASALVAAPGAYAGVVTQFTGFDNFDGTCPGADSPTFLEDWGGVIVALRGLEDVSKVTYDDACLFNRNQQARFYNFDGTVKEAYKEFGLPGGVAFSADEVGSLEISTSRGTTSTVEGDLAGSAYGAMTLDETNLGLPEIKVFADAAVGQRLTVNGFAATEYLWSGETEELSFFVDFDFFGSNEQRCLDGATGCTLDSEFNLFAGVSTDMPLDSLYAINNVINNGNVITDDEFRYSYTDFGRTGGTADDPILGTLELLFTVNDGDRFFLWAGAQAFAIDGGFLDAANTITTDLRLTADNTTDGSASRELFSTALQPAPPTPVDAPAPLHLLLGSAALLLLSRRKGRTGRIKP